MNLAALAKTMELQSLIFQDTKAKQTGPQTATKTGKPTEKSAYLIMAADND